MTTGRVVDAALDGVAADAYLVRAGDPRRAARRSCAAPRSSSRRARAPRDRQRHRRDGRTGPGGERAARFAARRGRGDTSRHRGLRRPMSGLDPAIGSLGTDAATSAPAVDPHAVHRPADKRVEARLFGGWLHDDNFGMASVRRLAHSELFADGTYLDETARGRGGRDLAARGSSLVTSAPTRTTSDCSSRCTSTTARGSPSTERSIACCTRTSAACRTSSSASHRTARTGSASTRWRRRRSCDSTESR